jgi:hypothetical protein
LFAINAKSGTQNCFSGKTYTIKSTVNRVQILWHVFQTSLAVAGTLYFQVVNAFFCSSFIITEAVFSA